MSTHTIDSMYDPVEQLCHLTRLLVAIHAYETDAGEDLTGATSFLYCLADDTAERVLAERRSEEGQ